MSEAVPAAVAVAQSGDTILLSPASASWDQYKCFEDRGIEFKDLVNKL
jgi:UDP-N-acetylmuramoylalanine--D-glutamate ligase